MARHLHFLLWAAAVAATSMTVAAMDASGERYARQMVNGGPTSIRQAAESIFHTHYADPEVLDVAAETLLRNYANASNADLDAMAWLCKALGASGNGRYKAAVQMVATQGGGKLDRHCGKAADALPDGQAAYVAGTTDLERFREGSPSVASASAASVKTTPSSGTATLKDITPGMSMDEVTALLGPPTATTSKLTGKAWIPFNFKGGDSVRTYGLYKGQGRIVFSKESAYTSTFRVIEVLENPNETGYP